MKTQTTASSGFTLVEIMIAVMIMGLLTSMALPGYTRVRRFTQNSKLANDLRIYSGAVEVFAMENMTYPEDSSSGVIPTGFEDYIKVSRWQDGPSIGGVWDVELNSFGIVSAVGVHRYTVSNEQLEEFDAKYDDGDLSSGSYRRLAGDRYYYIVAE